MYVLFYIHACIRAPYLLKGVENTDFNDVKMLHHWVSIWPVSYTHLTLPTNREV